MNDFCINRAVSTLSNIDYEEESLHARINAARSKLRLFSLEYAWLKEDDIKKDLEKIAERETLAIQKRKKIAFKSFEEHIQQSARITNFLNRIPMKRNILAFYAQGLIPSYLRPKSRT